MYKLTCKKSHAIHKTRTNEHRSTFEFKPSVEYPHIVCCISFNMGVELYVKFVSYECSSIDAQCIYMSTLIIISSDQFAAIPPIVTGIWISHVAHNLPLILSTTQPTELIPGETLVHCRQRMMCPQHVQVLKLEDTSLHPAKDPYCSWNQHCLDIDTDNP